MIAIISQFIIWFIGIQISSNFTPGDSRPEKHIIIPCTDEKNMYGILKKNSTGGEKNLHHGIVIWKGLYVPGKETPRTLAYAC
jgi:hypothetical protein